MTNQHLSRISTQWSEMEDLMDSEGPSALANYIAARYFQALAGKFKKYRPSLDDLQSHELASDILYEFLVNDYQALKRLDRDRGHLRGLFFKIIRAKLSKYGDTNEINVEEMEQFEVDTAEKWIDTYLDLEVALKQLEEDYPKLYHPFVFHYLEGRSQADIAAVLGLEENAVKQRLYAARKKLAKYMKEYKK